MYETRGAYIYAGWDRGRHICVCVRPEVHVLMRVIVVVCETGVDTEGIAHEWYTCCSAFDECDVRYFILYVL